MKRVSYLPRLPFEYDMPNAIIYLVFFTYPEEFIKNAKDGSRLGSFKRISLERW